MLWLTRYTPRIVRSTSTALALTLIVAAACADRVPTAPHKTTTQRASADISPSLFDSLWVTPSEVNAGDVATGTIVLHQPAPPGGAHILIRNYNYRVATWDSNLVVPQGYTRMNFTIPSRPTSVISSMRIGLAHTSRRISPSCSCRRPGSLSRRWRSGGEPWPWGMARRAAS